MKVYAHGEVEQRELALRYSLSLPGVSLAILGMDSEEQIDENVTLASRFQPLSEQEEAGLIEAVRPLIQKEAEQSQKGRGGKPALFWLHDTAVMGWREEDEPALVAY
jgi:predicted aldo/keto reductase-like oxidoreductase